MTDATSQRQTPSEGDAARVVAVRNAAASHASKHRRTSFVRSAAGGRVLSALMLLCETVNASDYAECALHLRGLPTRSKIKELHRYWFDTGIPLVVDLAV